MSALLVAVSVAIGARVVADNSFLTHLTTGDLMRARGSVPTTDPYSWTAAGADWTVQSWLASLIYSVVAELAGGLGIRLLNGVLCGLVMVGLLVLARRHRASFLAGVAAARRRARHEGRTGHAVDHPVGFEHGAYLDAVLLRLD